MHTIEQQKMKSSKSTNFYSDFFLFWYIVCVVVVRCVDLCKVCIDMMLCACVRCGPYTLWD